MFPLKINSQLNVHSKNIKNMDQAIIDGIIALGSAILGWLGRWLQTRNKEIKMTEENDKLKEVIKHYDNAAKQALKSVRRPGP